MTVAAQELRLRLEHFKETLDRSGIKETHQRREIFREVAQTDNHPDAETIFKGVRKRLATVSLDTVYRTLWLFFDLGLITTLGPPRTKTRFDANMRSHHHFVCVQCGKTYDFECVEFDNLAIPAVVTELGRGDCAQVEIKGLCRRCSKRK